ncbi:hypothetical protein [Pontibacillus marinus]|uniref:Uncharacterized protein n=1 Tax=Pontibacillus marinus BH030004 = DSM 16465 TaxID=1385511 RepID=A0A0A5I1G0_9BACI|nr:hypothetical protein [Pontibacillus marinus]KGX89697.1 hypothetical protein N783_04780 [Pontibacillus marinus BH030004 = DSM 16465]
MDVLWKSLLILVVLYIFLGALYAIALANTPEGPGRKKMFFGWGAFISYYIFMFLHEIFGNQLYIYMFHLTVFQIIQYLLVPIAITFFILGKIERNKAKVN